MQNAKLSIIQPKIMTIAIIPVIFLLRSHMKGEAITNTQHAASIPKVRLNVMTCRYISFSLKAKNLSRARAVIVNTDADPKQ